MRNSRKLFLFPRDNGSILIAALWVMVFFVILGLGVSSGVSTRIRILKKYEELVLGWPLARSAALEVIDERQEPVEEYDAFIDLGRSRVFAAGSGKAEYVLADESARINVNTATQEILVGIPGISQAIAENIISSARPYAVLEELRLVEGVTSEVWAQCREYLTVYGESKININTASSVVLAALGFDVNLVQAVLAVRAGADEIEGTEDDVFFESADALPATLSNETMLGQSQLALLQSLSGLLDVKSSALRVQVRTYVLGRRGVDYEVVVDQEKILSWREY